MNANLSYQKVMSFENSEVYVEGKNGGKVKLNTKWLCQLAREFYGDFNWSKKGRGQGFTDMLRDEKCSRGWLFGRSFHALGETEEEVWDYFLKRMLSRTTYTFPGNKKDKNLIEYFVFKFRKALRGIDYYNLDNVSNELLAKAFLWAIANTSKGVIAETNVRNQLRELFQEQGKSWTVDFSTPDHDAKDVDLVIRDSGKVLYLVSVKSGWAFSYSTIFNKYRGERKCTLPNLYIDEHLNYITVSKSGKVKKYFRSGGSEVLNRLERDFARV